MDGIGESLGKATLDLEANLEPFQRNMREARGDADRMQGALDSVTVVARASTDALNRVKMSAAQGFDSDRVASRIESSVGRVGRAAMDAADHLDRVKLTSGQAAETDAAGDVIDRKLKDITGNANEARRAIESVKLASDTPAGGGGAGLFGGAGGGGGVGALIAGGALIAPAAGPGLAGLLASLPALAGAGAGALGTLALALDGVKKAVGGDKKAFDDLTPAAQQFVFLIRSLDGWFDQLRQTASSAMFPGLAAGLKSALSPGTVGAITQAIREFGAAIGDAGAAWGRYFGSAEFRSIFGPIMATGAHNLSLLSGAALSLFDALGVLGRAALPLTTWLSEAAKSGAKLVDTWLHAKDASGQLGKAMHEAETSLQLVGGLLESAVKAVVALGTALYPVSKVAVKDLTDGLNALAGWISRNQSLIRELVGGALSDFVAVVKTAGKAISAFYDSMKQDLGNSAPIVAGIAAIGAAITIAMGPTSAIIAGAIFAAGEIIRHWNTISAWFVGFGRFLQQIFKASWQAVLGDVDGAIYWMLLDVKMLAEGLGKALGWVPGIGDKIKHAMQSVVSFVDGFRDAAAAHFAAAGEIAGNAWGTAFSSKVTAAITSVTAAAAAAASGAVPADTAAKAAHGVAASAAAAAGAGGGRYSPKQVYDLLINAGFSPADASNFVGIANAESGYRYSALNNNPSTGDYSVGLFQENFYKSLGPARTARYAPMFGLNPNMSPTAFVAWLRQHPSAQAKIAFDLFSSSGYAPWQGDAFIKAHPELLNQTGSPFGPQPPWSTNTGQPTAAQKAAAQRRALAARLQIPVTNAQTLVAHYKALAAQATTGGYIARYLDDEAAALEKENAALQASMRGKTAAQKAKIRGQIQKNEDAITGIHRSVAQALDMSQEATAYASFKSKVAASAMKLKADSALAATLSGAALDGQNSVILADEMSQAKLLKNEQTVLKGKLASAHGKFATQIKSQLATVTSQLTQVQDQVLQSLQGVVQTMQGRVGTAFQAVTQELDQQFEAETQKLLDAAAVQYFQNGAKTPLEQQLADMQAQDQLQQLQDAVTNATDAKTRAAAQRQLDEYNLSIRATAERAQADAEYAAATKRIQADRAAEEAKMNRQLATLGDAFQNGTGSMSDLTAIANAYGLQIDTTTIPDFENLSTTVGDLQQAFQDLIDYIGKVTGTTPKIITTTGGGDKSFAGYSAGFLNRAGIGTGGANPSLTDLFGKSAGFLARAGIGSIPSLDVGGEVIQSGLAMVHRGEFFTGVHGEALRNGGGDVVLMVDGREIGRVAADGLARNPQATRIAAKAIKPAFDKVVTVG